MKKWFLAVVFLILLVITISADNGTITTTTYDINITAIENTISVDETAKFLIYIKGTFFQPTKFKIYSTAVEWDIPEEFITISPKDNEGTLFLEIKPLHIKTAGSYGIPLNIKDETNNRLIKKNIFISVRSSSEGDPSVKINIQIPEEVDPRNQIDIRVEFANRNLLNLTNLRFEVTSSIDEINAKEDLGSINPLGKITKDLSFRLDPLEPSKENTITVDLYQNKKVIKSATKKFRITALKPPFLESMHVDSFLLKIKRNINYTSKSNVEDTQSLKFETNWLERLFTSASVESDVVKEDERVYYNFDLRLLPQETKTVTITTNYRIMLYILIILIMILVFYYKTKSPITIKKTLNNLGTVEGGISDMKIMLEINNRSKKDVKNITIREPIPKLVEVSKEFAAGTLRPNRILKSRERALVLEWKIDELSPGENRLIGYNIKSKLSIVGNFKLPRTKVVYIKKGKEQVAYSNSVTVGA